MKPRTFFAESVGLAIACFNRELAWEWPCQSCGAPMIDGTLLDCSRCRRMLREAVEGARTRTPLYDVKADDFARRLERICR